MSRVWRGIIVMAVAAVGLLAGALTGRGEPRTGQNVQTFTAYFYAPQADAPRMGSVLVPVVYELPSEPEGVLRRAFQALCDKPPAGLVSTLVPGCKVTSVRVDGVGTLTVDFTRDVFGSQGTSGESMVAEQLAMTASQFESIRRVRVAYGGRGPEDLGSHGLGNNFPVRRRSAMHLVASPVRAGQRVDTSSLSPQSMAVRNATRALGRPLLGLINQRLSEEGYAALVAREVQYVIPSGDGTLWVSVLKEGGLYQVWWDGRQWQVEGANLPRVQP